MAGLQPFLHDLVCTLAAPIQVWSAPDGTIHHGTGAHGVYYADTRVLSEITLHSSSHAIEHLATSRLSHGRTLFEYSLRAPGGSIDPLVTLRRTRTVTTSPNTMLREELEIVNASERSETVALDVKVSFDETPMEHVKQGWSATPGNSGILRAEGGDVVRENLSFQLKVPAPGDGSPHESVHANWTFEMEARDAVVTAPATRPLVELGTRWLADHGFREGLAGVPDDLGELLLSAFSDLDGLLLARSEAPDLPFLAAGTPWFLTLFGRDSLISAGFIAEMAPELAMSTLRTLAELQGSSENVNTAEQPGKILHEIRAATLEIVTAEGAISLPPLYYGTTDATALWVSLLHSTWRSGTPLDEFADLLPNLQAALAWMRDYGDADGDGFLEYFDDTGRGLTNQGWKDSSDSVRWRDGRIADGPIALAEVQGYAHRAATDGANLLRAFADRAEGQGRLSEASDLRHESDGWREWARELERRFRAEFWVSDSKGRYPAIALDKEKQAVDSVSSNMGHLLGTGILNSEEAEIVVKRLLDPEMFSGYGIRTISTDNGAFFPLRYHVGSVWPHDTAMAIDGMLAEGFHEEARIVARGLLAAARVFDARLPELFGGETRELGRKPLPYPASCRPQAWSAAGLMAAARALLPSVS